MMKHQTTLVTGLAALLVAPPILFGDEMTRTLEQALEGTVHAIEVVTGLEQRLSTDPVETIPLVLSVTEASTESGQEQDERLSALRQEVSLLQMQLDAVENADAPDPSVAAGPGQAAPLPGGSPVPHTGLPILTAQTGISDSVRAMLARNARPGRPNTALQRTPAPSAVVATPTVDPNAYSADPLGQAKASYRAGRYADGLVLLEGREDGESKYWRARCLARLERYDDAITTLTEVIASEGESYTAKRAATDLEFFKWKRDFDKKLPGSESRGSQNR